MQMVSVMNSGKDAAGILKLGPMLLSMVVPWLRNKVPTWANTAENIRLVSQIGIWRSRSFTSSTWVTVQSRHGFIGVSVVTAGTSPLAACISEDSSSVVAVAALSRNLQLQMSERLVVDVFMRHAYRIIKVVRFQVRSCMRTSLK